jgi:hypothetical protein
LVLRARSCSANLSLEDSGTPQRMFRMRPLSAWAAARVLRRSSGKCSACLLRKMRRTCIRSCKYGPRPRRMPTVCRNPRIFPAFRVSSRISFCRPLHPCRGGCLACRFGDHRMEPEKCLPSANA